MTLSCSCDYDWEPEPGAWLIDWNQDWDFEPLDSKRRKRCASCGVLIDIGAQAIKYNRFRYPYTEAESRINGRDWYDWEEPWIPKAPIYHCEKCGEIFLNLHSLGFNCVDPNENMRSSLAEYIELYDPKPLHGERKSEIVARIKSRETERFLKR